MRGRKPLPTALKVLRGTARKDRVNQDEPQLAAPVGLEPHLPLAKAARAEWDRLGPILVEAGILTVGDLTRFWEYCWLFGQAAQFERKIRRVGLENAQKLGYHNGMLKVIDRLAKAEADLGINPSARHRVKALKPATTGDAKERRFFGHGHAKQVETA